MLSKQIFSLAITRCSFTMPPKKLTGEKKKIVEDKTFGLKNKNKSAKVGRYVETVKNQAMHAGQSRKELVGIHILMVFVRCELDAKQECLWTTEQARRCDSDSIMKLTFCLLHLSTSSLDSHSLL